MTFSLTLEDEVLVWYGNTGERQISYFVEFVLVIPKNWDIIHEIGHYNTCIQGLTTLLPKKSTMEISEVHANEKVSQ